MSIAHIRTEYQRASLSEHDVDADPVQQFTTWFHEALTAKVPEVNAMSLSTVNAAGRPSSRIVLIKDLDQRGFTWFTHYTSRKGEELEANPFGALLFFWSELERQVRIEGRVEKISAEENDLYFHSRPVASQHGALASEQSKPIADRTVLEERVKLIASQYGETVPRPAHWGGYRLVPDYFEFWQGRPSRLHDRIVFTRNAEGLWVKGRLQP
ncbi:pyridoxamine 5'-phosphate oxidase [Oxalobacteraceae bacterium GrIS 2.11]